MNDAATFLACLFTTLSVGSLAPLIADGGVAYERAVRPVDEGNMTLGAAAPAAVTWRYFVEDGAVRVSGSASKIDYLFKDGTMYVIDRSARGVHVLKRATLREVLSHYADAVNQLEDAAARAAPQDRLAADQKAADMRAARDRLSRSTPREYRVTSRFESVDGRACRVWEVREDAQKRLEMCVAAVDTVPGGGDVLRGLKTMSQFREGGLFAFDVDFGLADWWPEIARLGGVPLLVRQYKYDSVVSETMLSGLRVGVPMAKALEVPDDYRREEGPDFVKWYAF